jgi:hypothetical protein
MNFADCELSVENGAACLTSPSFKLPLSQDLFNRIRERANGSAKYRLGIRPESINVGMQPFADCVPGSVFVVEPQGERTLLSVRLANQELFLVEVPPDFKADPDTPVYLRFREPIHLFEPKEGLNILA